ncbi:MAG: glutamate--tRNA ligase [Pseudomonadales bacterium]
MSVRTRIAPSPTGDPHVGNAYVALFNYCFAKKHGGSFVLRIEDTDRERSSEHSEREILRALRWVGVSWDEGPDVGGDHGPYRQSERGKIYGEYTSRLLDDGHAFRCFCTPERLAEMRREQTARKEQTGYDGRCLSLAVAEVDARVAAGESHVVRMKVPTEGQCEFHDYFRGRVEIPWSQVDMQILLKSDAMPTYHLANVVDDHLMAISHVIRGEDWINSVPKHVLLYRYFRWEPPVFCHLPLLRNPDKSKLSKRKNPTSINYYRRLGILPEALLNFLGLMGFSMPDGRERFALDDMVNAFDLERVSLGSPVFDLAKLRWLNGQWIRSLTAEEFDQRVQGWVLNEPYLARITPLIQERVDTLSELAPLADYLLGDRRALTAEMLSHKSLAADDVKKVLQFSLWRLEALTDRWQRSELHDALNDLAAQMGLRIREFLAPIFIAISGRSVALPLFDSLEILGSDLTRARIRDAIDVLGGVGSKARRRLEKEYDAGLAKHQIELDKRGP